MYENYWGLQRRSKTEVGITSDRTRRKQAGNIISVTDIITPWKHLPAMICSVSKPTDSPYLHLYIPNQTKREKLLVKRFKDNGFPWWPHMVQNFSQPNIWFYYNRAVLLRSFNNNAHFLGLESAALLYCGPYLQTQQTILETQHNGLETQHRIIKTQHKITECNAKLMCDYITYNPIISQPLTHYAHNSFLPFLFAGCGSEEVVPRYWYGVCSL